MAHIPETMRSLVAPERCTPERFEVRDMPTPTITLPTQVLIRVHAGSVTPGELQAFSDTMGQFFIKESVVAVGCGGRELEPSQKLTKLADIHSRLGLKALASSPPSALT